jgi:hypothetical protein
MSQSSIVHSSTNVDQHRNNKHVLPSTNTTATTSSSSSSSGSSRSVTPLPKWSLLIIYCARLGEPVSFTVLFPFVYFVSEKSGYFYIKAYRLMYQPNVYPLLLDGI